jgi:DNA-binding NarL/FixJ family response regulator
MPVKILSTGSKPLLLSRTTKARLPIKKQLPGQHGVYGLSRCQQRIIVLVAQGLKNCEIATEIGISVNVVKNYLQAIYDRTGMSNRVELALWYEARLQEGSLLLLP